MFLVAWTALAAAGQVPVVAVGGGLVAGAVPEAVASASSSAPDTVAGGWVPVLADCLEERAPSRFSVVDRAVVGETTESARARVAEVRDLRPAWVVVTLGAAELTDADTESTVTRLQRLVAELQGKARKVRPSVLLVALVPPTLSQSPPESREGVEQSQLDARTVAWNEALSKLASRAEDISVVDLWTDWPHDGPDRAGLTVQSWHLSDQGHARVAAAVCDALIASPQR